MSVRSPSSVVICLRLSDRWHSMSSRPVVSCRREHIVILSSAVCEVTHETQGRVVSASYRHRIVRGVQFEISRNACSWRVASINIIPKMSLHLLRSRTFQKSWNRRNLATPHVRSLTLTKATSHLWHSYEVYVLCNVISYAGVAWESGEVLRSVAGQNLPTGTYMDK
jgi:hypothetical protein